MKKDQTTMINMVMVLFIVLISFVYTGSMAYAQSIIIDHTCTDINQIPVSFIENAKSNFRIAYGHSSHGSQIVTGMDMLQYSVGSPYEYNWDGENGALSLHDYVPDGDLGDPDRTTWATRTRELLDNPDTNRNVIMWSWCGQVSDATQEDINTYLNLMNQLEQDYPDVTFIYMTGHLDGTGVNGNLNIRNNQIRDFCRTNGKVLFDFADIESYDPDGNYYLDRGADDGCYYDGGNWAEEWCEANPGRCVPCDDCQHSHCLNCQYKGHAFWWMMARLAGWEGGDGESISVGGSGAGPEVQETIDTTRVDGVNLLLSQRPAGDTNGRLYVSLEAPGIFPDLMWFRPDDAQVPLPDGSFIQLVRDSAGFLPGAENFSYFQGLLSTTASDLSFSIGTQGLAGMTLVFRTWYLPEGSAFSESNLQLIQTVTLSFT